MNKKIALIKRIEQHFDVGYKHQGFMSRGLPA